MSIYLADDMTEEELIDTAAEQREVHLIEESFDYLPPREHDMKAFGRVIPDESTEPQPPEVYIRRSEFGHSLYGEDGGLVASGGIAELQDLAEDNGWTWFTEDD